MDVAHLDSCFPGRQIHLLWQYARRILPREAQVAVYIRVDGAHAGLETRKKNSGVIALELQLALVFGAQE